MNQNGESIEKIMQISLLKSVGLMTSLTSH